MESRSIVRVAVFNLATDHCGLRCHAPVAGQSSMAAMALQGTRLRLLVTEESQKRDSVNIPVRDPQGLKN